MPPPPLAMPTKSSDALDELNQKALNELKQTLQAHPIDPNVPYLLRDTIEKLSRDPSPSRQDQNDMLNLTDKSSRTPLLLALLYPHLLRQLLLINNTLDTALDNLSYQYGSYPYHSLFTEAMNHPQTLPEIMDALISMKQEKRTQFLQDMKGNYSYNDEGTSIILNSLKKDPKRTQHYAFIQATSGFSELTSEQHAQLTAIYQRLQEPNLAPYEEAKLRYDWCKLTKNSATLRALMTITDNDQLNQLVPLPPLAPTKSTTFEVIEYALTYPNAWKAPVDADWVVCCFEMLDELSEDDQKRLLACTTTDKKCVAEHFNAACLTSQNWHAVVDRLEALDTRQSTFNTFTALWASLNDEARKSSMTSLFNPQEERDQERAHHILSSADFWNMLDTLLENKNTSPEVLRTFMTVAKPLIDHCNKLNETIIPKQVKEHITQYFEQVTLYEILNDIKNESTNNTILERFALIKRLQHPFEPLNTPSLKQLANLLMERRTEEAYWQAPNPVSNGPKILQLLPSSYSLPQAAVDMPKLSKPIIALLGKLDKEDQILYLNSNPNLLTECVRMGDPSCLSLLNLMKELPNFSERIKTTKYLGANILLCATHATPTIANEILTVIESLNNDEKSVLFTETTTQGERSVDALTLAIDYSKPEEIYRMINIIKTLPTSTQISILATQMRRVKSCHPYFLALLELIEALPEEHSRTELLKIRYAYTFLDNDSSSKVLTRLYKLIDGISDTAVKATILMAQNFILTAGNSESARLPLEMVRSLPLENQYKWMQRFHTAWGHWNYIVKIFEWSSTQTTNAACARLELALLELAYQMEKSRLQAADAKRPSDRARHALDYQNAKSFYTLCDGLSKEDQPNAELWRDAIKTMKNASPRDAGMQSLIEDIDRFQKDRALTRANQKQLEQYRQWVKAEIDNQPELKRLSEWCQTTGEDELGISEQYDKLKEIDTTTYTNMLGFAFLNHKPAVGPLMAVIRTLGRYQDEIVSTCQRSLSNEQNVELKRLMHDAEEQVEEQLLSYERKPSAPPAPREPQGLTQEDMDELENLPPRAPQPPVDTANRDAWNKLGEVLKGSEFAEYLPSSRLRLDVPNVDKKVQIAWVKELLSARHHATPRTTPLLWLPEASKSGVLTPLLRLIDTFDEDSKKAILMTTARVTKPQIEQTNVLAAAVCNHPVDFSTWISMVNHLNKENKQQIWMTPMSSISGDSPLSLVIRRNPAEIPATLATLRTLDCSAQAQVFNHRDKTFDKYKNTMASNLSNALQTNPIAKRDFLLLELASKVEALHQKAESIKQQLANPRASNRKSLTAQQKDYESAYETASALHTKLTKLARVQTDVLLEKPENLLRLLETIDQQWDLAIDKTKPKFKPHHHMQTVLNQLKKVANRVTGYWFKSAVNSTELLDELKTSKLGIDKPYLPKPLPTPGFFRPAPVKQPSPNIKAADNALLLAIQHYQSPPDGFAPNLLTETCLTHVREQQNILTLAIRAKKHAALPYLVGEIRGLPEPARHKLLEHCTSERLSLLTEKTKSAFKDKPDEYRDLFYLELERIILEATKKHSKSRMFQTLQNVRNDLDNVSLLQAVTTAQKTLTKETSWATWFGVSSTAPLRREIDNLLHNILEFETKRPPSIPR